MTGPDDYTLSEPLHHVLRNLQNAPHWNTASDALVVPMSRDPAVLAALPEVQALIAAAYEGAAVVADRHRSKIAVNEPLWHEGQDWASSRIAAAIRALTPADAAAALARIEAAAEARGRVKGLRDAAGVCRKIRASSADESEGVGALDCASAILARADQIERESGA